MYSQENQAVRLWVDYSLTREKYFIYIETEGTKFEVQLPFDRQEEADAVIDQLIASLMACGFKERRQIAV